MKDDLISRQAAIDKLTTLVNEFEEIMADIREKNVDDSVCGLCEYDCDHGMDGFANECPGFEKDDCFKLKDEYRKEWTNIADMPSALPKGHGRLIDADALKHVIGQFSLSWEYGQGVSDCWNALLAAPTIIEADKEVYE